MTALLTRIPDPGPATPTRVRPADFQSVGQAFADGQGRVETSSGGLRSALAGLAGAAGDDGSARSFSASYLPAADAAFAGFARLQGLLGAVAVGLGHSAENHRRAAADSTPGGGTTQPFPSIAVRPQPPSTGAPPIVGPGESPVPDWAAQYWPDGDPERLRAAGRAWTAAGDDIGRLVDDLHGRLTALVTDNDGEDVAALAAFWARLAGGGALPAALPRLCQALAAACSSFADAIEQAHEDMEEVIAETVVSLAAIGVGAVLLTPVTFGGSDVAGVAGGAAVISAAAARLAALAAVLITTVGVGFTVAGIAGAVDALRTAIRDARDPGAVTADTEQAAAQVGRGVVDENAKAFSADERRIAERLAERGHDVRSLREADPERTADALVDGVETEFKTAEPVDRGSNWVKNVLNESASGGGQARRIILDAEASTLTSADARVGLARVMRFRADKYDYVEIWTSDGIVTWP